MDKLKRTKAQLLAQLKQTQSWVQTQRETILSQSEIILSLQNRLAELLAEQLAEQERMAGALAALQSALTGEPVPDRLRNSTH